MFSEQELQMWHKITITWFMYWAHREYSVETYVNIRKGITHECIFWTDDSIYRNNTGVCLRTVYEKELNPLVQKAFLGFASGVMVAASVWSLLIPAMDMSGAMGKFAFIPAAAGLLLGVGFLLIMDKTVPHLHLGSEESEGPKVALKKQQCLSLQ